MQVQQRQHLLDLRGLASPRRQDRRREPLPLSGYRADPLIVDARRAHRHHARAGDHLARLMVAVAHHQETPVLVALVGESGAVGVHFGPQRLGQHPPRAPSRTSSSINDDPEGAPAAEPSRSAESETAVSMGRTFPTRVTAQVLLGTFIRSPGKVRPFPSRSTDFKHCSSRVSRVVSLSRYSAARWPGRSSSAGFRAAPARRRRRSGSGAAARPAGGSTVPGTGND